MSPGLPLCVRLCLWVRVYVCLSTRLYKYTNFSVPDSKKRSINTVLTVHLYVYSNSYVFVLTTRNGELLRSLKSRKSLGNGAGPTKNPVKNLTKLRWLWGLVFFFIRFLGYVWWWLIMCPSFIVSSFLERVLDAPSGARIWAEKHLGWCPKHRLMKDEINEWTKEWLSEWINKRKKERVNESINQLLNQWMNGWMNELMNEWNESIDQKSIN